MLKIQHAVENALLADQEALAALHRGFLNLSAYADIIQPQVALQCKKEVGKSAIVVSLSRLKPGIRKAHPLVVSVEIDDITTHAPLTEISFEKSSEVFDDIARFHASTMTEASDFLIEILSTKYVTVICSNRVRLELLSSMRAEPVLENPGLAAVGLALGEKYYSLPNITYSLLSRIAAKRIVLAETVTSHREILFVFDLQYLSQVLALFETKKPSLRTVHSVA